MAITANYVDEAHLDVHGLTSKPALTIVQMNASQSVHVWVDLLVEMMAESKEEAVAAGYPMPSDNTLQVFSQILEKILFRFANGGDGNPSLRPKIGVSLTPEGKIELGIYFRMRKQMFTLLFGPGRDVVVYPSPFAGKGDLLEWVVTGKWSS